MFRIGATAVVQPSNIEEHAANFRIWAEWVAVRADDIAENAFLFAREVALAGARKY